MATFHVGEWPAEQQDIYEEYNDALVADNLTLAWSLGCAADKAVVGWADFVELYQAAVDPLGGLTSWKRLRGGVEWVGPHGSTRRVPAVEELAGAWCVRLGGDPLGDPL